MQRKLVTIAGGFVVLALAAAGAGAAGGDAGSSRQQTLRFGVLFSDSFVDVGEPGPSAGDQIIGNDRLTDESGHAVGRVGLVCTVTDPVAPEAACQGTAVLPDGQIAVQFLN